MKQQLSQEIPALVIKWSVTNPKLIPAGAILTESQPRNVYVNRAKSFGMTEEDVAENRGNPGFESSETRMGRVGIKAVEALMSRFLRIEYRVVQKEGRHTKYAIMYFFVLNDEDLQQAVPMPGECAQALRWFALQTFEGCRIWNNPGRVVIDLVKRSPMERAIHAIHLNSTHSFCWAPLADDSDPSPVAPQFLTKEFVEAQRRREEAMAETGRRSLERLFQKAMRAQSRR